MKKKQAMKTATDPVFGEIAYSHSWKGIFDVSGFGKLVFLIQAYPDEAISEMQRDSFRKFMSNPVKFLSDANAALSIYVKKAYPEVRLTNIRPEFAIFQQNGVWGFVYPNPNGEDDGLSVRFEDNQVIADTDDALL